jgi:protein lysine acetyltransferase
MDLDDLGFSVPDRTGDHLLFRPIRPEHRILLASLFAHLSEQSRLRRFGSLSSSLTEHELDLLTDLDGTNRFAWGVELDLGEARAPVAVGRYARYGETSSADIGLTIVDKAQGRGIGGELLDALVITAEHVGIERFDTLVAADNTAMLAAFRRRAATIGPVQDGQVEVALVLAPLLRALAGHPLRVLLDDA